MSDAAKAVFLSYASQDAGAAKRIAEALRAAGIEAWFDQSELRGGDAWDQKIRQQIKECTLFVPIISANTQARLEGYFRREWRMAVERMHDMDDDMPFLVPVVIDGTSDAAARVPERFRERQWTRLPGGETTAAFCERVRKLLSGSEAGAPAVASRVSRHERTAAEAVPARPKNRSQWMAAAAVVLALVVSALAWQPWHRGPAPGTTPASAGSPARALTARALALATQPNPSRETLETAARLVEQALTLDPADAEVWAIGAQVDTWTVFYTYDTSEARREKARRGAARAVALDPQAYESRLARAFMLITVVAQPAVHAEAEGILQALIKERPADNRALQLLAQLLRDTGRYGEAAEVFRRAKSLTAAGWAYFLGRRFDEAIAVADQALLVDPSVANLELKTIIEASGREDLDAAQATADRLPGSALLEDHPASVAVVLRLQRREPEKVLEILRALPRDWLSSSHFDGPKAYFSGLAHHLAHRPQAAQADWRAALQLVEQRLSVQPNAPDLILWKATLLAELGERTEAVRLRDLERQLSGSGNVAISHELRRMRIAPLLDRREDVIDLLEAALRSPECDLHLHSIVRFEPAFDPLRGDPRFEKLLRDTLPKGARPFNDQKTEDRGPKTDDPAARPPANSKSIAVLPFENRSRNEDDLFFTDGIHDDLLTQISRIKDIKSISRTSVMTYRGSNKKLRAIAGELGVATVLEGGVQRAGNQVRINVQLIDAATDAHLWAETYTRALTTENVFAIQSEIATAIAAALQAVLTPEEKRQFEELPTQNLAALEAFFKAKSNDGSAAQTAEAIAHLQRALALDPDFAEAHALLADQLLRQVWTDGLPAAAQAAKAQPHVERALALASRSSNAHVALGHLRHRQGNADGAVAALRHAIELNPNNASAFALLGYVQLWARRDSGAAVESYRRALELDPLSPLTRQQTAEALSVAGRFDEARTELQPLLQTDPPYVEVVRNYGELQEYAYYRLDEAIKAYRRVVALDPRNPNFATKLAMAHFRLGDTAAAQFWFERALAVSPQSRETGFLAGMLNWIQGEQDAAIAQFRTVRDDATFRGPALQFLVRAALADGRPESAAAELLSLPPPAGAITQGNIRTECMRASLLAAAGRRAEADELGNRILAALPGLARKGQRGYYSDDALVHLARGDRAGALAAFRELSNAGACATDFGAGAAFQVLHDDPDFQALLRLNATRLAEQRANLERWEAAGELAPLPPAPESPK